MASPRIRCSSGRRRIAEASAALLAAVTITSSPGAAALSLERRAALSRLVARVVLVDRPAAAAAAAAMAALTTTSATPSALPALASEPAATVYSTAAAILSVDYPDPRSVTTVLLDSPSSRAGVELYDAKIGVPPRTIAAVRSLLPDGEASRQGVLPGMVVLKYPDSAAVKGRLKGGPYPVVLQFYSLAGDAGDGGAGAGAGADGTPTSPRDALVAAEGKSSDLPGNLDFYGNRFGGLEVKIVQKTEPPSCGGGDSKSRKGDTLEVKYEARIGGKDGILYDSSDESGVLRYVLGGGGGGSDDLPVRGVDLGTYDMCAGEVREVGIPSALGYGRRGNQQYLIPPGSRLWWRVELLRIRR